MNIIKSFEDFKFFDKHYEGSEPNDPIKDKWEWGLGDDGNLYCRCSEFNRSNEWLPYPNDTPNFIKVSFSDMMRIVKQFGHLVIFT